MHEHRVGGHVHDNAHPEAPCLCHRPCSSAAHRVLRPQVASGRFGVTPQFLVNADQLEIKIAQGAKPGAAQLLQGRQLTRRTPEPHNHDESSCEECDCVRSLQNAQALLLRPRLWRAAGAGGGE